MDTQSELYQGTGISAQTSETVQITFGFNADCGAFRVPDDRHVPGTILRQEVELLFGEKRSTFNQRRGERFV